MREGNHLFLLFKLKRASLTVLFFLIGISPLLSQNSELIGGDTVRVKQTNSKIKSPHKATLYSAVLPGMGQIYNGSYWKVPLVWGGLGIAGYALYFNQTNYYKYKNAYRDYIIQDPANTSYEQIIIDAGLNYDDVKPGGKYSQWFSNTLNNQKLYYRKYRDYSYVAIALIYTLNIVDAAVDAHFTQFDISDDLTMKWQPYVEPSSYRGMNFGVGFNFVFK